MTPARLTFFQRAAAGSRLFRVARRIVIIVTLLYAAVGAWSAYRAWVQVRALDLEVMSPTLRPGLPAVVHVVTSGRTPVDARLELIQGTHVEMLATMRIAGSRDGFFDPRARQGTMTPSITTEFLAKVPGPELSLGHATMTFKYADSFASANALEGYEHRCCAVAHLR
jgi:hypothetical protein